MKRELNRVLRTALSQDVNSPNYPGYSVEDGRVIRRVHSLVEAVKEHNERDGRAFSDHRQEKLRSQILLLLINQT